MLRLKLYIIHIYIYIYRPTEHIRHRIHRLVHNSYQDERCYIYQCSDREVTADIHVANGVVQGVRRLQICGRGIHDDAFHFGNRTIACTCLLAVV